jgi:hypothetical protein
MKNIQHLFVLTFLLIIVLPINTISQTSKILWEDVLEKYESFENFAPVIHNNSEQSIYWGWLPYHNRLLRFDEVSKEWIEGNYILSCGTGFDFSTKELESGEKMVAPLLWSQFFEGYQPLKSFVSNERGRFPVNGKYKIRFYFGTKSSDFNKLELHNFSDSPEFLVNIK